MMSWAAQTHLAGRVFETPGLDYVRTKIILTLVIWKLAPHLENILNMVYSKKKSYIISLRYLLRYLCKSKRVVVDANTNLKIRKFKETFKKLNN